MYLLFHPFPYLSVLFFHASYVSISIFLFVCLSILLIPLFFFIPSFSLCDRDVLPRDIYVNVEEEYV